MKKFLLLLGLAMFSMVSPSASAQQLDSTHSDWSVFSLKERGKKICYIATAPRRKSGNYKKRGEPYLIVTHRSKSVDEVSTSSGYPYKKDTPIKLVIDKKNKFNLYPPLEEKYSDIAWTEDSKTDRNLVIKMKKGKFLTVRGESRKNTYSEDMYSLIGITKAYKRMKALCK